MSFEKEHRGEGGAKKSSRNSLARSEPDTMAKKNNFNNMQAGFGGDDSVVKEEDLEDDDKSSD